MYVEQVSFRNVGKHFILSVLMTKLVTGADQFIQVDQQKFPKSSFEWHFQ